MVLPKVRHDVNVKILFLIHTYLVFQVHVEILLALFRKIVSSPLTASLSLPDVRPGEWFTDWRDIKRKRKKKELTRERSSFVYYLLKML